MNENPGMTGLATGVVPGIVEVAGQAPATVEFDPCPAETRPIVAGQAPNRAVVEAPEQTTM